MNSASISTDGWMDGWRKTRHGRRKQELAHGTSGQDAESREGEPDSAGL